MNDEALELGINFSKVLQNALLDEINRAKDKMYGINKE